ncbi:hypothetical protein LTR91_025779 [Friedmanniomyces endolithicus]|uniref:DUF7924 domain-containing protein n=1 Tax=Friedmanniomyces endolithicus TaxID=329885 RepID=A0AAN6GZK9_9PEZI|nr:hypothetical protein LTR38_015796 [Friedmanniomyces endolithicus]KAK0796320.1 hypothetical protein LTR75_010242 [Friedmanniomyces endolithicus]KAK0890233.1 hypothetical protein LTR57_025178 [Friedmanniomyces endolithicus]KAK0950286.1 hypothetical protein LTR91_025779 [Friedmanniomyces endolithicus]KAK0951770.1 hypothetical protein LTS01_025108 [Friedmanniomyces endolithicus]
MATGQNDTRLTTYLLQHAGVKRTRTQERQLPRKSARLAGSHQKQPSPEVVRRKSRRHNLRSGVHRGEDCTQQQQRPVSLRRLRTQNDPAAPDRTPERRKRRRSLAEKSASVPALSSALVVDEEHPIAYWAANKHWPEQYIEKGRDMENILARKRSVSYRSRKNSDTDSTTPSSTNQGEQKSREQKSAEYKKPQYAAVLATKGVFMGESQLDISPDSQRKCRQLLEQGGEREIPEHSLFRDDLFKATCKKIQDKNEARIIQDITRLIVPSAETLNTCGATHLRSLTESVNEGWNNSIAITKTRPQPDYAVGFSREAFTQEQLDRMHPVVGDYNDQSYFMATWYMYFPFLTCEVKCGAAALDVADRQNAHSTAIAVRAVVELFRTVKREQELHREILAFSISHDHCSARIYGYYAEFEGTETKLYRHTVHKFDFTALGGKEKWTAYKFTKNVYDHWMPMHFKRICSAIDQIPAGIRFSESQSELHFSEPTGLSQDLSVYSIARPSEGSMSARAEDATTSSAGQDATATPGTSVDEGVVFKKPRKGKGRRG